MPTHSISPDRCPECSGERAPAGPLQHTTTCSIQVGDQQVIDADRARLQAQGHEGYQRPIKDAERARLTLDGATIRKGALVAVGTLWVNGRVVNPQMVHRDWSDAVL